MKRFLKIFGIIIGGILILLIGIVIFLQTSPGQRIVRDFVVDFLETKFGTPVHIDKIEYSIPKNIQLEGVIFIDKNSDTLLSLDYMNANISMMELLRNKLKVNALDVEGLYAKMHRSATDTVFNYQYIIDAFSDTTDIAVEEDEMGKTEPGQAQSMLFNVAKVRLKNITFIMDDKAGGTYFDLKLDSLLLKPKEINPGTMTYLIDEIYIHRAHTTLHTFAGTLPPDTDTSTSISPLILSAEKLSLTESSYRMLTEPDSFYLYAGLEKLNAELEIFDLEKSLIQINDILLENATNEIVMGRPTGEIITEEEVDSDDSDTTKWRIYGDKLVLNNIYFKMDDNSEPRLAQGMDYSHMDFSKTSLMIEDLNFLTDSIYGNLLHLTTEEKSGLKLMSLRTEFLYHDKGVELNELYVQTPETVIQDNISISYPSIDHIAENPGSLYVNMRLVKSHIAINDIILFSPESVLSMISPYKNQMLKLNGEVTGYLSNLKINNFEIEGLSETKMLVDGTIVGLPDTDRMRYEFNTLDIATAKKDILPFIPKSLAQEFSLPDEIHVVGSISGTVTSYNPDVNIKTSDGDVAIKGNIDIGSSPEKYNLALATNQLDVGKIIKNDSIVGRVSMNGHLVGTSFDVNKMDAQLIADVTQLEFNGYNYTQVHLNGNIDNQLIELTLNSQDFNANMNIYATVDISQEYPSVTSTLQLKNVDLHKLKFYEDELIIAGDIDLNFSSLNPDYPAGYLNWAKPIIKLQNEDILIDSVYISSEPDVDSGQNIIAYIPELLDARLRGQMPLSQIGTVTMQHLNKYFVFDPNLEVYNDQYNADIQVEVNHHRLINKFVPGLDSFATMNLTWLMNQSDFYFKLKIPYLAYGDHVINDLDFTVHDTNQALVYNLSLEDYNMDNGSIYVNRPELNGRLKNNLLEGHFKTVDFTDVENYSFGFNATYTNDRYTLSLLPQLKLNHEQWSIPNGNWVSYLPDSGLLVNNIGIRKGNESIFIQSTQLDEYNSPIDINIQNFELANATKILNPDTLLAEGVLNARINADIRDTFPRITGNLSVKNLAFYETEIGDLAAEVSNQDLNTFDIDASITQLQNNIFVKGKYYMSPVNNNDFDMDIDIQSLNLQQFEGLTFGHLSDSRGFVRGALELTGTVDVPKINGHLETDELATRINIINSLWSFPKERIEFNNQQILFNDFKIYDSLGKHATIAGAVKSKDFVNYDLNLNFKSDKWMATNSSNKHFEWMYGKTIVTSNIDITGTSSSPVIKGNLVVHDSTDFTYANIDEGPSIADHEGYVVFVNDVNNIDTILNDTSNQVKSTAMNLNLNIETEKNANFNVLVNALSGDILRVNGAAFLNANMIPGGQFLLSGSYQIEGGYYELNYNLIKRKFLIQEGSVIQLSGDPLDAEVNITAAYTTDASAYDLVEKSVNQEELVFYKQRMPFDVLLKITGKPLNPIIKYDIVLSEESARQVDKNVADNIQRQLSALRNDVSEMSKQVFGMLILGRFIADDPIKSGNPISMEYYARQTASRFLSQQLNNLADKYVNGLDLSLDIESQEDYSSGQRENRTDLNFRASKTLFEDRLTITIGNDFQLEGRQLPGQQNSLIPGNISLDYKLTKDGKYNIRGYRKNELINVIDGYVVETGAAFMLSYDYNRFRELFYSRERLRELNRKRREEERKREQENQANALNSKK